MNRTALRALALLCAALMLSVFCLASCGKDAPLHAELDFTSVDPANVTETASVTDYVCFTVAEYGDIIIRLYPEVAPITVANFQSLISEQFYDGVIFHRVVKDFVIQAGEPVEGNDKEYPSIKGEFALNGVENNLKHIRGVVSTARTSVDMNSGSTQFYICQQSASSLNSRYAAFGYVVSGMDVVDAIAATATDADERPLTDVVIEKARFVTVAP